MMVHLHNHCRTTHVLRAAVSGGSCSGKPFTSLHAHATCELPVYECVALTDHLMSEHASDRHTHSKHGITSGDYIAWIVE